MKTRHILIKSIQAGGLGESRGGKSFFHRTHTSITDINFAEQWGLWSDIGTKVLPVAKRYHKTLACVI